MKLYNTKYGKVNLAMLNFLFILEIKKQFSNS